MYGSFTKDFRKPWRVKVCQLFPLAENTFVQLRGLITLLEFCYISLISEIYGRNQVNYQSDRHGSTF